MHTDTTYPHERAAASVRRLVTRRVLGYDHESPGLLEALTLCRHLKPGQHEAAIVAHRQLVRLVRADLARLGTADEEYLSIANALVDYLYSSGFELRDGRWQSAPSEEVELGPRLVEAG